MWKYIVQNNEVLQIRSHIVGVNAVFVYCYDVFIIITTFHHITTVFYAKGVTCRKRAQSDF